MASDVLKPREGRIFGVFVSLSDRFHRHHHIIIVEHGVDVATELHDRLHHTIHRLSIKFDPPDEDIPGLGPKLHQSGDTVPVTLSLVGHTVRVLSHTDVLYAIIDTHGNRVPSTRHEERCHVILMGCGERPLEAHLPTVDIDDGLDMRPFQEKRHVHILPVARHIDTPFVPGLAHIVLLWCQEERKLHVTLPPILFHPGIEVVRRIIGRARPAGVDRHRITLPVGQQRPGQHHIIVVTDRVAEGEVPRPGETDHILSHGSGK